MTKQRPQKPPKLLGWMKTARTSLTSSLSHRLPLNQVGDDLARRLPALSQGVGMVAGALSGINSGGGLLRRSFFVVVFFPTVVFFLYSALWQSDRYVAETRLTVREAQKKDQTKSIDTASIMSKISGAGGGSKDSQNSYVVLNYVKSRAIVVDLGGRAYLERKFAGSGVDFFSRLSKGKDLEDLWKYWLDHLSASVDNMSGILTIKVDAFQPQDALDVAHDIIRLSEDLVNKISLRNRGDTLARADAEVVLSRQKLAEARERVLQFRNQNLIIDPGSRAASLSEMISKLTLERIELANSLSTLSSSLSSDAPTQRIQKTRLATLDQQIADLKKKLTDSGGSDTVSAQIAEYERLKLEEQFNEKLYGIAQSAYESARQDLARQQLYLMTVVTPILPESATYPRVAANTALFFCALLVAWAIVALVAANINDQIT